MGGGGGSIVVYSGYEGARLSDLAESFPTLAPRIEGLRARLFDLLPVMRRHVYDPAFGGSFSIKSVVPALVPELAYDGLAIREGQMASLAYLALLAPETTAEQRAVLRSDLLAYCGRGTEALLGLFQLLR